MKWLKATLLFSPSLAILGQYWFYVMGLAEPMGLERGAIGFLLLSINTAIVGALLESGVLR